jgi:predicted secreted protein
MVPSLVVQWRFARRRYQRMHKEGVPMGKGKLMARTLGIVLVFVLIGVMLGGLLVTPSPFAEFASHSQALAQGTPELDWSKTFGGLADDFGDSVQQTSNGGYVVAGYTNSRGAGGYDVWLMKTDSNGNKVWDKTFGGNSTDTGSSVQQTSDGGYVVVGGTNSYGAGGYDVWLIKTDSNGNKVWDKTFGGISDDGGSSVQQTSDGGYAVAGYTISYGAGGAAVWLIKTDSSGNEVWNETFGGTSAYDMGVSIQQTSDGGCVIVGYTNSCGAGGYDVWLIKTDSNGNKVWDKTFGGNSTDTGNSVRQTSDGGYIIVGHTNSYGAGGYDVWLIKTDSNGNKVWDKTFGGTSDDGGSSVQQTSDGGYIVVGGTGSYGAGVEDVWLIKTDSTGNKVWDKTLGGPSYEFGEAIQQTSDGGYVITGTTESYGAGHADVWLMKVRPEGELPITPGNTPVWVWTGVALGAVSLVAIIVYVVRRKVKAQHSE